MAAADKHKNVTIDGELLQRNIQNGFADLSLNKRAFALNFLVHYDHRKAAIDAKYPASKGKELLRDPLVASFIRHMQDESQLANVVTEELVRTYLLNLIPMYAGEIEVPVVTKDSYTVYAKKFHAAELLNLLKTLREMADDYKGVKVDLDLNETFASIVAKHRRETDADSGE